jgi:hypothetical protein
MQRTQLPQNMTVVTMGTQMRMVEMTLTNCRVLSLMTPNFKCFFAIPGCDELDIEVIFDDDEVAAANAVAATNNNNREQRYVGP